MTEKNTILDAGLGVGYRGFSSDLKKHLEQAIVEVEGWFGYK